LNQAHKEFEPEFYTYSTFDLKHNISTVESNWVGTLYQET